MSRSSSENRGVFFFFSIRSRSRLYSCFNRSKNHQGQSNEQQRQQQKLDPAFERAKKKVRQNRTRTGWVGCMLEGQYKHLVFGHDRSHPGPRRCAARAGIRRSCPHTRVVLERFSKPNFGSIRRFRTMTGLEIENWIEKRGRTVRKFRSTRPRTESNFRFGLTSCRSQNLPTEVRSLLCQVFDSFSLVTSSSSHHASHLRGFIPSLTRPNWRSIQLGWRWTFWLRQEIFGRYMAIISEWMGKRCWPWDHQWSRTWQKESPGLAQFDKEHFFGTQGLRFSTARHQSSRAAHAIVW